MMARFIGSKSNQAAAFDSISRSSQHAVLPAQAVEFLVLGCGQTIAAQACVQRRLFDPLSDRIG
jgi:hypothetical protein